MTRRKCVIKKVMPHGEFIDRIRKSLYFGGGTDDDDMEISRPLAEYASCVFSEPHKGHSLNRLNKVTAGSVHATPCSLIMALIYLDRLNSTDPGYVRRITPSELFIVSMMISTKFYSGHDEEWYLSDWAEDGQMTENKLKQLELEFLSAIEWNIYISNEQFFAKLTSVEKILAEREGLRRGWLTYTELAQMLPSFTLAKFLINNITIMAVSYAASVMTIAGAFFLASQIPGNALHRIRRLPITVVDDPGAGAGAAAVGKSETIMNGTIDVDNDQTNTSTSDQVTKRLATPPVFDVEEELLKLEQQYRNDNNNNNNNDDDNYDRRGKCMHKNSHQPIYYLNSNELLLNRRFITNTYTDDIYIHLWQRNYKDEYSEENNDHDLWPNNNNNNNKQSLTNLTKTILWNLLSDAENTIARLPVVLRKFI